MTSTISQPAVRSGAQHSRRDRHAAQPGAGLRSANRLTFSPPVSDKVRPPRSSVPLLERPRITGLIGRATAQHRVTLVCGPSGAGKTVACAAWALASAETGSVGWLSLDYGDRWPRQLWAHVRLALATTAAVPGEVARDLPDPDDDAFPLRLPPPAPRPTRPGTPVLADIRHLSRARGPA